MTKRVFPSQDDADRIRRVAGVGEAFNQLAIDLAAGYSMLSPTIADAERLVVRRILDAVEGK